MESSMIQAEMVGTAEFEELTRKHGVRGVPQTTINDGAGNVVGAVSEHDMIAELKRIIGK